MNFAYSLLGKKPPPVPVNPEDSDFADFAAAPAPSPASIISSPADYLSAQPTDLSSSPVLYTKWYRVWERTKPSDFYLEAIILPLILLALLVHTWGNRANKRKARKWMAVHAPVLDNEFALVGYHGQPKTTPYAEGVQSEGLLQASAKLSGDLLPDDLLKQKTAFEYQSYASGRQNVAFLDVKLTLMKRYNPILLGVEYLISLFFESYKPPSEKMESIIYTFDGNEKNFVPGAEKKSTGNSSYDGFVFAIVNKMNMRKLRDDRYDVSLTSTKEHAKLPNWATVMSESAEVTEMMLTKDLISAVEQAGDALEYLVITDQPQDKPATLDETVPKKRLHLSVKLPSSGDYLPTLPLFQVFLRLPDHLAQSAHFRPEVMRKINTTREVEIKKLKKVSEAEAEEDRKLTTEKLKKEERERRMKGMTAEEQKKFLEKERERERKKSEKKQSRKA